MPKRQRNAGAGYRERSRTERAKARVVQPLTYVRMLVQHNEGLNVAQAFCRHACAEDVEQLDPEQAKAFMALVDYYSSPYPCYDAAREVIYEWVDGREVERAA